MAIRVQPDMILGTDNWIEQTRRALTISLRVDGGGAPMVLRMQDLIHQINLENHRRLLAGKLADAERVLILKLLGEERQRIRRRPQATALAVREQPRAPRAVAAKLDRPFPQRPHAAGTRRNRSRNSPEDGVHARV